MRSQFLNVQAIFLALTAFYAGRSHADYDTSNATGQASSQILNDPFPYWDPQLNASATELFAMPLCNGCKIEDATIDQLQAFLGNGSLTSVQLVECYLRRAFQTAKYIK